MSIKLCTSKKIFKCWTLTEEINRFSIKFFVFRLFYKNKSIEISCLEQSYDTPLINASEGSSIEKQNLEVTQDYLISDSLTGRYYTCYSLNKRSVRVCLNLFHLYRLISILNNDFKSSIRYTTCHQDIKIFWS